MRQVIVLVLLTRPSLLALMAESGLVRSLQALLRQRGDTAGCI